MRLCKCSHDVITHNSNDDGLNAGSCKVWTCYCSQWEDDGIEWQDKEAQQQGSPSEVRECPLCGHSEAKHYPTLRGAFVCTMPVILEDASCICGCDRGPIPSPSTGACHIDFGEEK